MRLFTDIERNPPPNTAQNIMWECKTHRRTFFKWHDKSPGSIHPTSYSAFALLIIFGIRWFRKRVSLRMGIRRRKKLFNLMRAGQRWFRNQVSFQTGIRRCYDEFSNTGRTTAVSKAITISDRYWINAGRPPVIVSDGHWVTNGRTLVSFPNVFWQNR